MQRCGDCFYARDIGVAGTIACHRNPPTTKVEGAQITSHFPLLGIEEWCGEWKVRADTKNIKPYRGKL